MIGILTLFACLSASNGQSSEWPTLREVLMKHSIEGAQVAGIDDADKRIDSYEAKSEPRWFGIAYYWHEGERLPPQLRIRTFDRVTGRWRHALHDAESLKGGSAVGIGRAGAWVYVDLHINPSAGSLVVLTEDLRFKRRLDGWSSLPLPDGRIVYENNMVHFAPYHPAAVSLYDPKTDRDEKLFPFGPVEPPIEAPQDRSIGTITSTGPNRFEIKVIEQDLRWRDNVRTEPVGPERRYTVACDVSAAQPRCSR